MTNILYRAQQQTGDAVDTILLVRLAFRWRQALNDGREWTAQSHRHLHDETFFSYDQIRRSVSRLRKGKLIETKRDFFANKNVLHFRLTEKAVSALEGNSAQIELEKDAQLEPRKSTQFEVCKPAQFLIQGETTASYNNEKQHGNSDQINLLAKSDSGIEQDSEEDQQCETNEKNACASAPENEEAMSKHEKSVYDVVAARKAKMLLHKPDNAKALGNLWLTLFAEHHGPTVKNLNTKQLKQLKDFILAMPEGKASEILERVITEWKEFTSHSKDEAGAFGIPSKPTLDFLLKYVGCAVSFASSPNHQQEAPVFVSKKVEPLQSIALWKKPSLANPDTGSLEEALAIFNDDTDVN